MSYYEDESYDYEYSDDTSDYSSSYTTDLESGTRGGVRSRGVSLFGEDLSNSTKNSPTKLKKPEPVDIQFKNVRYCVPVSSSKKSKDTDGKEHMLHILKGVSGRIEAGKMTAILGASGAGKTTLLNFLAGRLVGGVCKGQVTINGDDASASLFRSVSAYVTQDDVVPELLTPLEALSYAAGLRLPDATKEEKTAIIEGVLHDLHLWHRKDTIIGVPGLVRGLSGGERKRVNVGLSLVSDCSVLFLDEPTSGLDSTTALKVIQQIRELAEHRGLTVLATIHQPSVDIMNEFDDVMILADGRECYAGPPEDIVDHFADAGHRCPTYQNPADFVMNVITPENHKDRAGKERVQDVISFWRSTDEGRKNRQLVVSSHKKIEQKPVNKREDLIHQVGHLVSRNFVIQLRNKLLTQARFAQTIFFAVLMGIIYYDLGDGQTSVQGRQGALFLLTVNTMMMPLMGVLFTFPSERALFLRERSDGTYSTFAYYASKVFADMPYQIVFPAIFASITYWMMGFQSDAEKFAAFMAVLIIIANIGAAIGFIISGATGDIEASLSIAPAIFMPMLLFSSFLVNLETTTDVLSWIRYINPVKYAFAGLALNEFRGLTFLCENPDTECIWKNGEQVIDSLDLEADTDSATVNVVILIAIGVALRIIGYFSLLASTRKRIPK